MLNPQLETFIKVVESGSFSKAAASCFCSTVSVMNQINALESRIGARLLLRSTKGVRLTPAGQSFYADARKIIVMSREAIRNARECAKGSQKTIRIGASILRPCKPLLDYIEKSNGSISDRFKVEIVTFDDKKEEFSNLLANLGDRIDCFVSPCDSMEWNGKLGILQLGTCRCCIALPRSHRLARKEPLSWADMSGESIILVKKGISPVIDQIRDEIESSHAGIRIIDSQHYYDIGTFNKCVEAGCLMEIPEIWGAVHPSLAACPVQWDYQLPYGIIYGSQPTPAFQEFIKSLKMTQASDI